MPPIPEKYKVKPSEPLYRVILPLGLALISFVQLPIGQPTFGVPGMVHMAVFVVGMFIAFNQTVELLDRRLNWQSRVITERDKP